MKSLLSLFVILLCVVPAAQAATITYAPSPAVPGQSVTLAGQAAPNTFMSFYLGSTHVGVANVNARGQYRHTFTVPANLRPGEVRLSGGCDKCGNGWQAIPLKLAAAERPAAAPDPARYKPAVEAAYGKWLGRAPNPQELDYWTKALAGGARTEASMHQSHQAHLRQHERDATIKRSYQAVFKRDPNEGELNFWRGHVQSGRAWYENMVQGHREWLAKNPPKTPGPQRYQAPVEQTAQCVPGNVRLKSEEIGGKERCFGATGNGCASQVNKDIPNDNFKRGTVNGDCTVSVLVTVGAILHDNCCLELKEQGRAREGHMCTSEWWTPQAVSTAFDAAIGAAYNDGKACAREWRKATYDVLEDRFWSEKFGPYLTNSAEDDLNKVPNPRRTQLPGRLGVLDNLVWSTTGERMQSRRLQAPSGTKLEFHDVQFCASGRFKGEGWCQGPDCSNPAHLAEARKWLSDWQDWKRRRQQEMTNFENRLQGDIDAWDNWAQQKEREANQFWPVDPRAVAIRAELTAAQVDRAARVAKLVAAKAAHGTEMTAAEPDGATRRAFLARRQQVYDARTKHWGICQ